MKIMKKSQTPLNPQQHQKKIERRAKRAYAIFACLVLSITVVIIPAFAADDPLQIVENLSEFIFSLIRAIGLILLLILVLSFVMARMIFLLIKPLSTKLLRAKGNKKQ